jgi:ATP adenylyltransferase
MKTLWAPWRMEHVHLHFHIVPCWADDHNFMAVLGEVRSVPENLLTTYDRLLPVFQEIFNTPRNKQ